VAILVNSNGQDRQEMNVPAERPAKKAVDALRAKKPEYGGVVT